MSAILTTTRTLEVALTILLSRLRFVVHSLMNYQKVKMPKVSDYQYVPPGQAERSELLSSRLWLDSALLWTVLAVLVCHT